MKTLLWNFSWRIIRNTLCYSCCVTVYFVNMWIFKCNKYEENSLVVSYSTTKDEFTKQLPDVKYGDSFAYLCINSHIIEGVKRKWKTKDKSDKFKYHWKFTLRRHRTLDLKHVQITCLCSMHWSIAVRAIHERRMGQSRSRDSNLLLG